MDRRMMKIGPWGILSKKDIDQLLEVVENQTKATDRIAFLLHLGVESVDLLDRCYRECDMDPELAEDVGTHLLRITNLETKR